MSKRPWRAHLTRDEIDRLAEIDLLLRQGRRALSQLSWTRHKIQNRATTRAALAARRGKRAL